MKGTEDLGGGMKAIFQLKTGFNIYDGTTAQSAQSTKGLGTNATTTARLFGPQAWVGLSYKRHQAMFGRTIWKRQRKRAWRRSSAEYARAFADPPGHRVIERQHRVTF